MRFWNKDLKSKADSRVAKMDTSALTGWMDNSIMSLGQSFYAWRFHDGTNEDVSEVLTALNSIWSELEQR